MTSLNLLGLNQTDKASSGHDYLWFYELFLQRRRFESLTFLEIGVGGGGSLRMWRDYFPNAQIIGMDIEPDCRKHAGDRIYIFIGDQREESHLKELVELYGKFDVINDDAGHDPSAQTFSYEFLMPHLNPNGLYILEDIGSNDVSGHFKEMAQRIVHNQGMGVRAVAFHKETVVTLVGERWPDHD